MNNGGPPSNGVSVEAVDDDEAAVRSSNNEPVSEICNILWWRQFFPRWGWLGSVYYTISAKGILQ